MPEPSLRRVLSFVGVLAAPLFFAATPAAAQSGSARACADQTESRHAERIWATPTVFDLPTLWVSDLKIEAELH